MSYMGHVISKAGMAMDEQKVRTMLDCPIPPNGACSLGIPRAPQPLPVFHPQLQLQCRPAHWFVTQGCIPLVLEEEADFNVLQRALIEVMMLQLLAFKD
jgi:hypothetical protein